MSQSIRALRAPARFCKATRKMQALPIRRIAAGLAMIFALAGCGAVGVKPWERDLMARPDMALDAAPVDSSIDDHVYFSKEGASGGRGFGGGGCGCN